MINTKYIARTGVKPGVVASFLLKNGRTKHLTRMFYSLRSVWQLKQSLQKGSSYKDFFQAGKSVEGVQHVEPAGGIVDRYAAAAKAAGVGFS